MISVLYRSYSERFGIMHKESLFDDEALAQRFFCKFFSFRKVFISRTLNFCVIQKTEIGYGKTDQILPSKYVWKYFAKSSILDVWRGSKYASALISFIPKQNIQTRKLQNVKDCCWGLHLDSTYFHMSRYWLMQTVTKKCLKNWKNRVDPLTIKFVPTLLQLCRFSIAKS